jgi:hypothetical protein
MKNIISEIIKSIGAESYLHIAPHINKYFNKVKLENKVHVDNLNCLNDEETFDVVVLDSHSFEDALTAVLRVVKNLNEGGLIVVKNINPFPYSKESRQVPRPPTLPPWRSYVGDVWKLYFNFRFLPCNKRVLAVENDSGYLFVWKTSVVSEVMGQMKIPKQLPDKKDFNFISLSKALELYKEEKERV